jgi:hypothetical protein
MMNFMERMEAGRDQAAYRRHRGLMTGKSAAGWDAPRRHGDEHSWHEILFVTRTRWELARDEALQIYATAMFPERFEDLPF